MKKILYRDQKNILRETTVFEVVDGVATFSETAPARPIVTNKDGYIDQSLIQSTGAINNPVVFNFATPLIEWVINHNFGYYPFITLFSIGGMLIEAEVVNASLNQIRVRFTVETSGQARVF